MAKSLATANENETKHSSCGPRNEGKEQLTFGRPQVGRESPARDTLTSPCQPLNEVWQGVDPGSTTSSHSAALLTPELTWVGPAFPPGVPSLFQAVT